MPRGGVVISHSVIGSDRDQLVVEFRDGGHPLISNAPASVDLQVLPMGSIPGPCPDSGIPVPVRTAIAHSKHTASSRDDAVDRLTTRSTEGQWILWMRPFQGDGGGRPSRLDRLTGGWGL